MQDKEWVGLVHALKRPEWLKDVRFQTKAGRNVHRNDRLTMMAEVIALWDSQELLERLSKFGVPCGPVNHPRSQVLKDPQVIENDLIKKMVHPWCPYTMRQPRAAAQFSTAPWELRHHAPLLGEHSVEVLREWTDMTEKEIAELLARNVIQVVRGESSEQKQGGDARKLAPSSG